MFHERLGEELANELVGWFNQVDATYRIDLKEFNEVNFARFEAKLERRLGEQTRWLVVTWATLLIPIVGLWFRG